MGYAHCPKCNGSTHLPSSTGLGGSRQDKVRCALTLVSGGVACLTSTPIKNIAKLYGCSFKEWIPYLVSRTVQRYFKNFPHFILWTILIYSTETRTFIFNILSFLLDTLSPKICECFHAIRRKVWWLIMKWVMHCFRQLIMCKLTTSYSILDRSNGWKLEGAKSGLWAECSRTSQFSCWMLLKVRFFLSRIRTHYDNLPLHCVPTASLSSFPSMSQLFTLITMIPLYI